MSHMATTWLAQLPPQMLSASEFRVLFHLCDCHNPASGCFPTQAYLIANTGVSNGTLNNALNALEERGLIRRHREIDGHTRRQRPTRYLLGFEIAAGEPSPVSGDGNAVRQLQPAGDGNRPRRLHLAGDGHVSSQLQPAGDGAVSNFGGEPSPIFGGFRLQPTGEEPVREPVINQNPPSPPCVSPVAAEDAGEAEAVLAAVLRPATVRAFVAHRKAKRAKLTVRAAELIADKLRGCAYPDAVVERSIMNGWTGVFPDNGPAAPGLFTAARGQGHEQRKHDELRDIIRAAARGTA